MPPLFLIEIITCEQGILPVRNGQVGGEPYTFANGAIPPSIATERVFAESAPAKDPIPPQLSPPQERQVDGPEISDRFLANYQRLGNLRHSIRCLREGVCRV